jgi:hypothetical protein
MAPQEVAGLQALALAHGGSLTINPDTGLPEAGFLKKLLPMLAGAALNFFAPGVGSAIGAALGMSILILLNRKAAGTASVLALQFSVAASPVGESVTPSPVIAGGALVEFTSRLTSRETICL